MANIFRNVGVLDYHGRDENLDKNKSLAFIQETILSTDPFYLLSIILEKKEMPLSNLEFLAGLIISMPFGSSQNLDEKIQEAFIKELSKYIDMWTLGEKIEIISSEDIIKEEKRIACVNLANHYSFVRGKNFYNFFKYQLKKLFSSFEDELRCLGGFDIEDVYIFLEAIAKLEENQEVIFGTQSFISFGISSERGENLLREFSLDIRDEKFRRPEFLPGDYTVFKERPILKLDDQYIVLSPEHLIWSVKNRIERILKRDEKIWERYSKINRIFLQKNTRSIFQRILPESKIYRNLKYVNSKGEGFVDCLIVDGEYAFLVSFENQSIANLWEGEIPNRFFQDEATEEIVIENMSSKKAYILDVNLDDYPKLSLDLLEDRDRRFPSRVWRINANTLYMIYMFLRSSKIFLDYVRDRMTYNNLLENKFYIDSYDEMGFLGWFLRCREYQNKEDFKYDNIDEYIEFIKERYYENKNKDIILKEKVRKR